jgi:hypothetical protein
LLNTRLMNAPVGAKKGLFLRTTPIKLKYVKSKTSS